MAGIDAGNGKLLWRADRPGKTAVISTPIYDKGTLYVTSAYGGGCNGFKVEYTNNQFVANEIYKPVGGAGLATPHGGGAHALTKPSSPPEKTRWSVDAATAHVTSPKWPRNCFSVSPRHTS